MIYFFAAFLPLGIILFFLLGGIWKTITKAGQPGWASLVPIYNFLILADVARVPRAQAWKAMAFLFIGTIINLYISMNRIISAGQESSANTFGLVFYLIFLIVGLIFLFKIYKGIALNFGQSAGFAWGLLFLNVIFFAILGFGSASYQGGNYLNDDLLDSDL